LLTPGRFSGDLCTDSRIRSQWISVSGLCASR
jgi:hypothetical protein